VQLANLSCERDERLLFSGLTLSFAAGEVVQIMGPNGAGKTTLLRILAGISRNYQGALSYQGAPMADMAWEFAQNSLYLGHLAGIKKALTPAENLAWYAAQRSAAMELPAALAAVGLYGYEDTPCYQLSAGQLRRVALARLHLSSEVIWILDEPFTAIDKLGVSQLETIIEQHSKRGGLVLLTSHQDLQLDALRIINLEDYQPADGLSIQHPAAFQDSAGGY
jgi:heme exporter protein A